MVYSGLHIVH